MARRTIAVVGAILLATVAGTAQSERELREEQPIKALQSLPPVAIVIRPSMPVETVTLTEAADIVQAGVNRALPDFKIVRTVDGAKAWMELGIVTAPEGGMVELAVYRWVRIEGINDDVFTKVWSESRLVLRGVNRTILREAIDSLVTKFAADYLRAKKSN